MIASFIFVPNTLADINFISSGVLVMNSDGVPIKSVGMTTEETETYAALVSQVRDICLLCRCDMTAKSYPYLT